MPVYNLYWVNAEGQIARRETLRAMDDDQAIILAAPWHKSGEWMELWQDIRRVQAFTPESRDLLRSGDGETASGSEQAEAAAAELRPWIGRILELQRQPGR